MDCFDKTNEFFVLELQAYLSPQQQVGNREQLEIKDGFAQEENYYDEVYEYEVVPREITRRCRDDHHQKR